MGTSRYRRSRKGERNAVATVELALMLPLLIVLCLAAIDIGRYGYIGLSMDSAVRVGAGRGATRTVTSYMLADWKAGIQDWVNNELADAPPGWMSNLQVTVNYTTTSDSLSRIQVSADAKFGTIVNWPFVSQLIPIHREIVIDQYR